MSVELRDPATGRLNFTFDVEIALTDQLNPIMIRCRDWPAARRYLASAEFGKLLPRLDFVTLRPIE